MAVERQDLVTIGSNIAKYRKLKNYTQKELGDILDVNYKTISKWENGNVAPDITLLKSLADVLDISLDELLSGIKVKHKKNKFVILLNTILCLFIVFLTGVLIYFNNTKYDLYEFKSNHDLFNIEGYIVSGKDESRFVIDKVVYTNLRRDFILIKEMSVVVYSGDFVVYSDDKTFDKKISLEDALELFNYKSFTYDTNDADTFITISYKNDIDEYKEINIPLEKTEISKSEN